MRTLAGVAWLALALLPALLPGRGVAEASPPPADASSAPRLDPRRVYLTT